MSQTQSQSKQYFAPRQGFFAFILLLSFVCHVLVFLKSNEHNLRHQENITIKSVSARLANDVKVPLSSNDRVSLAVIAKNYESDPNIAYVGIYTLTDELIVPAGDESVPTLAHSFLVEDGTGSLGKVIIKPVPIDWAVIFKSHWLFVLASLLLHVFVWLLYGHFARPTREFVNEIQDEAKKTVLERAKSALTKPKTTPKVPASPPVAPVPVIPDPPQYDTPSTSSEEELLNANIANDTNNALIVRFVYQDAELLDVLVFEQAQAYFALCNQLLDKTLKHLLKSPNLSDVGHDVLAYFDKTGAVVKLQSPNYLHCLMAGAMLVKTFTLVSQDIYQRRRDEQDFALHIKTILTNGVSYAQANKVVQKRYELSLVLLDDVRIKEISRYMTCEHVEVMSADEQNCHVLKDALTPNMMRTVDTLAKSILQV